MQVLEAKPGRAGPLQEHHVLLVLSPLSSSGWAEAADTIDFYCFCNTEVELSLY